MEGPTHRFTYGLALSEGVRCLRHLVTSVEPRLVSTGLLPIGRKDRVSRVCLEAAATDVKVLGRGCQVRQISAAEQVAFSSRLGSVSMGGYDGSAPGLGVAQSPLHAVF